MARELLSAEEAQLPGEYLAWLADEVSSPSSEGFSKEGPFILSDGLTLVAESWADLIDGTLQHAIDLNEYGELTAGPPSCNNAYTGVWTGVTAKGEYTQWNCGNWTDSGSSSPEGSRTVR